MTLAEAVRVLNANAHLGRTDWRVGNYSGAVFGRSTFIYPDEAIKAAKAYQSDRPIR